LSLSLLLGDIGFMTFVLGALNLEVIAQLGILGAIILAGPIVIFLASSQQN